MCPTSNLCVVKDALGMVQGMPHLKTLRELKANFAICTDDTMLFSTNISTEMFEYAKGFGVETSELREMLLRNCDAIFDESCKEWL